MQLYTNLIKNKIALNNIRYSDKKQKANLIFVPEEGSNGLSEFLNKQIKSLYSEITVPGIISNFLGKRLSSQQYYISIKKELPNYIYNRVPNSKEGSNKASKIFDMSAIIGPIMNITKSRSKKAVFQELIKLFDSVVQDYIPNSSDTTDASEASENIDNILFIYGGKGAEDNPIFLQFLKYIMNLTGGKFNTKLDAIIYMFNNKHYPLAIKGKKPDGKLHFIRGNIELLLKNMEKVKYGEDEYSDIDEVNAKERAKREEVKLKINELSKKLEDKDIDKNQHKEIISNIKKIVHDTITTPGTFQEKLEEIYKNNKNASDTSNSSDASDNTAVQNTPIDKISGTLKELNKKYNGNIQVDIKSQDPVDPMKIVGMKSLSGYNKQEQELNENMDENIKDLVESTLLQDKDLNIEIVGFKTKIVDNYNNRYKEYSVKIKHKDIGKTTNKPYNITFRTPITVQGKYTRIGGNNYIMINQLFSAPISKISPVLTRFYSHFGTTSLELKNTRLTASHDFKEVEDKFITEMKSIKAIKDKNISKMNNKLKDELRIKYNLEDIADFNYEKLEIEI